MREEGGCIARAQREDDMKNVLAVTDGSAPAQNALAWAAAVCSTSGSRLSVATAWQPEHEMDERTRSEHLELARRRLEDDWCATLRATDVPYEAVVLEGDPRQVVPPWAVDQDADLVVLGTHGRGRDHRIGSVTTFLAHNLQRPLAAVPQTAPARVPERIVLGVDGSTVSSEAVQWCATFAPEVDATVLAVFAEVPVAEWVPPTDPKSWLQRARHSLDEWTAPLREASVGVTCRVVQHEAGRALVELAHDETTDLVVLGARGRGGFAELLLGSTALKVLHRSDVPVVLVPAGSQRQA
jgi:nucleotide-binding universal stress UspA family protein